MAPALQISIPTTSIASPPGGKQYTVYHVALQLPLRLHEVRKRYSDFVNLHDALTSQSGKAPPAPIPPKSWIRSTLHNDALTEQRRKGLENYVRAIIESDDARWRSSVAWRTFLNLPSGTNTLGANGTFTKTASTPGAGSTITDANQWLDAHRDLKTYIQTARQRLKQREAATTAQTQHQLSADAKASLVRAAAAIAQLDDGLKTLAAPSPADGTATAAVGPRLGDGELRRRRDLVGAARSEVEGLEGVLKSMATRSAARAGGVGENASASAGEKEALLRGATAGARPGGRVLGGGPPKETTRTRELDNSGVLQLQQQIMQEQDEDVMLLGKTVAKLKDMGIMINEELAIQNEMLTMVDQDVDRVQGKVDVARKRIAKIK